MPHREALDVHLVDDRLVPRRLEQPVALPVEGRVDHDALRHRDRVVLAVGDEIRLLAVGRVRRDPRRVPVDAALDRPGVGVDHELRRVEPVALLGGVGAVHAVAVALPGADPGQVSVPVERGTLRELVARLATLLVVEAELDPLGVLGEQREVRSLSVPRRAEWGRAAGPQGYWPSGTSQTTLSGGSASSADHGWPPHGSSAAVTSPLVTPEPP